MKDRAKELTTATGHSDGEAAGTRPPTPHLVRDARLRDTGQKKEE